MLGGAQLLIFESENLSLARRLHNQELQVSIAEALYDVDSIVADPEAYTREELATLHSQIVSNLERAWELSGGSEDQLDGMML